ncbi:hypothetical protein D9758_013045 [Tetrapyrgos nigripes]|uniref:HTH CENPB-type domain-containing protein n=1 Tax=Tetrapyrgos nigripes TaxID=182062 RepID=A0A8H5CPR0_9AGAR|nr:hypothetical protein D9758_013045 [Tetrapyrgos nigripes]
MPPKSTLDLDPLGDPTLTQEERMDYAVRAMEEDPRRSQHTVAKFYEVPRATLGTRLKGIRPRKEAHEHEQNLSNAQEEIMVEWAKVRGRRGVPMSLALLGSYAAHVCGRELGASWPQRFLNRHPDLKIKLTQLLESCRAKALNQKTVNNHFDLLESTIKEFNIDPEHMWNMDEKGIQLGIGRRIAALVDREQKSVYSVQSGNRDLITIVEAVNAKGKALHSSFIFPGMKRDLRWAENNPDNASISISPNGWTDQELGLMWLEKDFEPNTRPNPELKRQTKWHSHGILPAQRSIDIDKYNLLFYFATARASAFQVDTIIASFVKCGIHPLNRHIISPEMYEPSKLTTTKSALPIGPRFPTFLTPVLSKNVSSSSDSSENLLPAVTGLRLELPQKSRSHASRETLLAENDHLRSLMEKCIEGMSEMYAHMKLMEVENADLRKRAFDRTTKKKAVYFEGARLMTSLEMLEALARSAWGKWMKEVFTEAQPRFKEIKNRLKAYEKGLADTQKEIDRQKVKEKKEREHEEKKAERARVAAENKERKRVERERIKEAKRLEKEGLQPKLVLVVDVVVDVAEGRGKGSQSASISDNGERFDWGSAEDSDSSLSSSSTTPIPAVPQPKPRPRPVQKRITTASDNIPTLPKPRPKPMPVRTNNSAPEQPVVHIDTDSTGGADTDSEKDPLLGDEGNSESESEAEAIPEEECIIAGILRHQWSWSELMFEVAWRMVM